MGDESAPASEVEEQEFTGEELQVAPEGAGAPDPDADLDDGGDGYEDGEDDDPQALAARLPVEPGPIAPPGAPHPRPHAAVMEPRDPAEVLRDLQFDHMTDGDQAAALRAAGGRPEHSLDRARRDILQERELAARAVAYREWPEEFAGTSIKGRVRSWKAPFTVSEIEEWLASYRGGGKYKIQLYMGNGRYLDSKVLDVEGDPLLPGAKEDAEERAREERGSASGNDDRAVALERQLAEERFERRMSEERSRTDQQMTGISNALASLVDVMKHNQQVAAVAPVPVPQTSAAEVLAGLAASPIALAFLESRSADADRRAKEAREDRKFHAEQQAASEKRMMTMMTAMQGKKEGLSDAIKAMGEVKKLTGGENTEAKAFNKILDTALPKLIDATTKIQLHKAGVTDDKDDEEFGAKMIVERVTDLATAFIATKADAPPQQPQQPQYPQQPQQPGAPAAASHGQYGVPVQQPPGLPTRGGGAIVTPEQQAQHEAMVAAAQARAAQTGALPPGAPQTSAPQQAAPQQAAPQQAAPQTDVNLSVFVRALEFMAEGKLGSELAHQLMAEEEAHQELQGDGAPHLYLSPRVIQYLCLAPPASVMNVMNPQIAQHPQYQGLLDPIGQQFMHDFCLYFSSPEEEPVEEGGPEPGEAGEVVEGTEATNGADDITGGASAEGATE